MRRVLFIFAFTLCLASGCSEEGGGATARNFAVNSLFGSVSATAAASDSNAKIAKSMKKK